MTMKRFLRSVTLAVLALTTLTETRLGAQDAIPPFIVGVWGTNNALLPFADFDGQRWRSRWPAPVDAEPAPLPLQRVPASWWGPAGFQPVWEAVEPDGGRRELRITGTDSTGLGSGCSNNIGLKTDVPQKTYQYARAVATSRPGVIETVERLKPDSADWRTLMTLLPDILEQREMLAWKDVSENWRPNLSGRLLRPVIEAAFISADAQGQYVYFEARRDFTPRPGQLGNMHSFIAVWLWRRSSTSPLQTIDIRVEPADPDRKGTHAFDPLGIVRYGSRQFWLGALSSYAYGAATVLDVRRAGIKQLVIVEYPGC